MARFRFGCCAGFFGQILSSWRNSDYAQMPLAPREDERNRLFSELSLNHGEALSHGTMHEL